MRLRRLRSRSWGRIRCCRHAPSSTNPVLSTRSAARCWPPIRTSVCALSQAPAICSQPAACRSCSRNFVNLVPRYLAQRRSWDLSARPEREPTIRRAQTPDSGTAPPLPSSRLSKEAAPGGRLTGDDVHRERRIHRQSSSEDRRVFGTGQKSKSICWAMACACWERRRAHRSRFTARLPRPERSACARPGGPCVAAAPKRAAPRGDRRACALCAGTADRPARPTRSAPGSRASSGR